MRRSVSLFFSACCSALRLASFKGLLRAQFSLPIVHKPAYILILPTRFCPMHWKRLQTKTLPLCFKTLTWWTRSTQRATASSFHPCSLQPVRIHNEPSQHSLPIGRHVSASFYPSSPPNQQGSQPPELPDLPPLSSLPGMLPSLAMAATMTSLVVWESTVIVTKQQQHQVL